MKRFEPLFPGNCCLKKMFHYYHIIRWGWQGLKHRLTHSPSSSSLLGNFLYLSFKWLLSFYLHFWSTFGSRFCLQCHSASENLVFVFQFYLQMHFFHCFLRNPPFCIVNDVRRATNPIRNWSNNNDNNNTGWLLYSANLPVKKTQCAKCVFEK